MGMFGGGGGGQKLDVDVDFPLDGLDMSMYVKGSLTQENAPMDLIYDCYAVSNHYGNMGFGHYTAYSKNPLTNKWYEYDDSRVTEVPQSEVEDKVVTSAAYNLFFRHRGWHEMNMKEGVNYSNLAIRPDLSKVEKK
jgi:ubiquitin C-terminal hydrolase